MDEALTTETRTAQKDYHCDAWTWINNAGFAERDLTPEQWQSIKDAKADGYKILKGQKYLYCRGMFNGEWSTYRARPELDRICHDLELFDY